MIPETEMPPGSVWFRDFCVARIFPQGVPASGQPSTHKGVEARSTLYFFRLGSELGLENLEAPIL